MNRSEEDRGCIFILKDESSSEDRTLPNDDGAPRSTIRRKIFQSIELRVTEITKKRDVKMIALCFLQTHRITVIFRNTVFDRIPFLIRVDTTNIPAKNLPLFNSHGTK